MGGGEAFSPSREAGSPWGDLPWPERGVVRDAATLGCHGGWRGGLHEAGCVLVMVTAAGGRSAGSGRGGGGTCARQSRARSPSGWHPWCMRFCWLLAGFVLLPALGLDQRRGRSGRHPRGARDVLLVAVLDVQLTAVESDGPSRHGGGTWRWWSSPPSEVVGLRLGGRISRSVI